MGKIIKWLFFIFVGLFSVYLVSMSIFNPRLIGLNSTLLTGLIITPLFVLLFKKIIQKHKARMYRSLDAIEYVERKNNLLTQDEILKILFLADLDYYKTHNQTFFLVFWFIQGDQLVSQVVSSHFDTESRKKFKEKNIQKYENSAKEVYPILDQYIHLTDKKINDNVFGYPYLQGLRQSEKLSLVIQKLVKDEGKNEEQSN